MKKISLTYNLILTLTLLVFALSQAPTNPLLPLAILPLPLYFLLQLFTKPKPRTLTTRSEIILTPTQPSALALTHKTFATLSSPSTKKRREELKQAKLQQTIEPEVLTRGQVKDIDRRMFLKLIGSAGLTTFLFSLFTDRTHAAFFGSMPGPGTISIKDSAGNKIDPSEKQPTDGYKISQVDDSSPAYYGFVDKTGAWYIQKEDSSGNYRYTKGTSSFSTNWTNRASLTYDYFDNIF